MDLGNKLMDLRKKKGLSQEEVADKLNVTRQTVSKWETNQSTPDFDKIVPLCELYEITPNELMIGKKDESVKETINEPEDFDRRKKKTTGLISGIISYFVAIAWIMISIPALRINPVIASAVFLLIIGVGTCIIIYTQIMYKEKKKAEEELTPKKRIEGILAIITLIIYLLISFLTMAWHITWIIWIIYGLVNEIVSLILSLRGDNNAK